jgi:hypothetical protein
MVIVLSETLGVCSMVGFTVVGRYVAEVARVVTVVTGACSGVDSVQPQMNRKMKMSTRGTRIRFIDQSP